MFPIIFSPTIESHSQPNKFLPDTVENLLSNGELNGKGGVIVGLTEHEGCMITIDSFFVNKTAQDILAGTGLRDFITARLFIATKDSDRFYNAIKDKYQLESSGDDLVDLKDKLVDFLSDVIFVNGSQEFSDRLVQRGHNVRQYTFSHPAGENSLMNIIFKMPFRGTCHGDELPLQFDSLAYNSLHLIEHNRQMSRDIVDLWTSFASYEDSLPVADWVPQKEGEPSYLWLSNNPTVRQGMFHGEFLEFFRDLAKQRIGV